MLKGYPKTSKNIENKAVHITNELILCVVLRLCSALICILTWWKVTIRSVYAVEKHSNTLIPTHHRIMSDAKSNHNLKLSIIKVCADPLNFRALQINSSVLADPVQASYPLADINLVDSFLL